MHELSLAQALLERVLNHAPKGAKIRKVVVEAGPLQMIEPDALRQGWIAVSIGTLCEGSKLDFTEKPWQHQCMTCGNRWESKMQDDPCKCGSILTSSQGSSELMLLSIDVDDAVAAAHH